MALFIILCVIIIGGYLIYDYGQRDKSKDYQHTPLYRNLSYENRLRMDIVRALEVSINKASLLSNDAFEKHFNISATILDKKIALNRERNSISNKSNVPVDVVTEIIQECCTSAYNSVAKIEFISKPEKNSLSLASYGEKNDLLRNFLDEYYTLEVEMVFAQYRMSNTEVPNFQIITDTIWATRDKLYKELEVLSNDYSLPVHSIKSAIDSLLYTTINKFKSLQNQN